MRAVGLVIGIGGGLEQGRQFLLLLLLPPDLVLQQRHLPGQLAVGIIGLARFFLLRANAGFHLGLVDGIGLGGFFRHEVQVNQQSFK